MKRLIYPFTTAVKAGLWGPWCGMSISVSNTFKWSGLYTICTVFTTAVDAVKSRAVRSLVWYEHAHNHFSSSKCGAPWKIASIDRSVCIPIIVCVQLPVLSNYHQHTILTYRAKSFDLIPCFFLSLFSRLCKKGYVLIVYIWDLSCLVSVSLSRWDGQVWLLPHLVSPLLHGHSQWGVWGLCEVHWECKRCMWIHSPKVRSRWECTLKI